MARRTASRLAAGQPLAGASVIVTRPAASASALRRRVRALGGKAVALPGSGLRAVAATAAARAALRQARAADVVVFTSPAAVRFAFQLEPRLRFARSTRICVPGGGSARALRRRGIARVEFPAQRQDSEGVLALPAVARVRGRRIVVIGAPGGRELLPQQLAARGARVETVHVYRRTPPRLTRRHFAALERAAAPLIGLVSSAEALDNLHALLPAAAFARLAASDCVVSSERIAARARALGFAAVHVANSPQPLRLLEAAAAALARRRP